MLAIGIVGILAGNQIRAKLEAQVENELMAYARIVDLYPMKEIQARADEIARIAHARVTVIDRDGRVIAETEQETGVLGSHLERPEIQEARVRGRGTATRYSQTLREEMMYVALPIPKGQEIVGYIRLARPLVEVRKSIEEFTGHPSSVVPHHFGLLRDRLHFSFPGNSRRRSGTWNSSPKSCEGGNNRAPS